MTSPFPTGRGHRSTRGRAAWPLQSHEGAAALRSQAGRAERGVHDPSAAGARLAAEHPGSTRGPCWAPPEPVLTMAADLRVTPATIPSPSLPSSRHPSTCTRVWFLPLGPNPSLRAASSVLQGSPVRTEEQHRLQQAEQGGLPGFRSQGWPVPCLGTRWEGLAQRTMGKETNKVGPHGRP